MSVYRFYARISFRREKYPDGYSQIARSSNHRTRLLFSLWRYKHENSRLRRTFLTSCLPHMIYVHHIIDNNYYNIYKRWILQQDRRNAMSQMSHRKCLVRGIISVASGEVSFPVPIRLYSLSLSRPMFPFLPLARDEIALRNDNRVTLSGKD